ncbi:MAG: TonB-dependent receptor domain-containing protein [Cypionkella sp.]
MRRSRLITALLLAGASCAAAPALAQSEPQPLPTTGEDVAEPPADGPQTDPDAATDEATDTQEEVEISAPGAEGAEIVVTGRFIPEPVRNTAQVVSVLSSAEIARTGDGDISGALQRVTGLSVNTSGFVYVRGLGDRYSLALLNGLALPSPEPLRRVVPLDIFPTSIVSSAVVQKSYSVNYPGEYGGGVINLTTASLPDENYLTAGVGISGDSETTAQLGYTYYGSRRDVLGFDDGTRDLPAALRDNDGGLVDAGVLENEDTLIIQRNRQIPANFSASLAGGYGADFGDTRFGALASLSFSNGWRTRGATQETATAGSLINSSYGVRTENKIQGSALLALGLDLPAGHKLRLTNVYINDTSKVARVRGAYQSIQTPFEDLEPDRLTGPYDSLSYESSFVRRQLLTSQAVGEFEFGPVDFDLRGSYSKSDRDSPYERTAQYLYVGSTGGYAVRLGTPTGVIFSTLDETVWAGGADIAYDLSDWINGKISAGYAYSDTGRTFQSLNFVYDDGGAPIAGTGQAYLPIFVLLTPELIDFEDISLRQSNRAFGQAEYRGDLTIHGGYLRGDVELAQGLRLEAGVRYETAEQRLTLPDLYGNNPAGAGTAAVIDKQEDYWLPAATLTWNFAEDFQLRLHGSKTIARPQFRELGTIPVLDVESDRQLAGNPFLTDSQLWNAEGRIEWYPARGERVSLAGFYKSLDAPIETIATIDASGALIVTNANAPKAELYGIEAEAVKYIGLGGLGESLAPYRLALSANYTWSRSRLQIAAGDETVLFPGNINSPLIAPAAQVFTDGSPLTGQSEHLANLQFGIENTDRLEQLTFLLTYASERVTSRGANTGGVLDPDIVERPGLNVDIVARQGWENEGWPPIELKFEARNVFGRDRFEFQDFATGRARINNYAVGTTFAASISAKF